MLTRVFIDDGDPLYPRVLHRLSEDLDRGEVVPLLGAGVSRAHPSSLPLANDLRDPLVRSLWKAAAHYVDGSAVPAGALATARSVVAEARLERLLDAFHQTHGETALEYLLPLNSDSWNENHAAIAALALNGYLEQCITLNFDLLIERAVEDKGGACETVCTLTQGASFRTGAGKSLLTIIKPHGSFAPSDASANQMDLLSATLSQIGSRPARANVQALKSVLSECPVLFVAGYSDDDWDIFPILVRHSQLLKRVFWVQYARPEVVKAGILATDHGEPENLLSERIAAWMEDCDQESWLLIGAVDKLFSDLLAGMGVKALEPKDDGNIPSCPDAAPFLGDCPADRSTIATALSLATLLHNSGRFNELLLNRLSRLSELRADRQLSWRLEYLLAHILHTRGDLPNAMHHARAAICLKPVAGVADTGEERIWLGYEYLCLCKRPNPLRPLWLFAIPYYLNQGLYMLKRAVRSAAPDRRDHLEALAKYYRVDLLHSWGNILMVLGRMPVRFARLYFRFVARLYDGIARKSDLMDGQYYWLRHLEAKLLADLPIERSDIDYTLDEIEWSYQLVQDSVQLGNTHAYRALLFFLKDKSPAMAEIELDRAEAEWSRIGPEMAAGRRRTVLFRRFMGKISFLSAVKELLEAPT